ncbi:hypothetical protein SUDANB121_03830 [Nocardiopsis dassonvillei]|uniref:DUF6924 domain-containing protein n=1 Tax=Nocardiopsis dassonvillei TaxID=2014 RepID=UPI003F570417
MSRPSRPFLPLPPADDGPRVFGTLLLRTGGDDAAWADVLSRMGPLPGLTVVGPDLDKPPAVPPGEPRRLLLAVDAPAWRDAAPEEVREALGGEGTWMPDLVLLVTDATAADPRLRPLVAFRPSGGEAFQISPRLAALVHLVLHHPLTELTLEGFEEWSPVDGEEDGDFSDPVGAGLETLDPAPRYEPPARPLPPPGEGREGLLVRTDFTDDTAWSAVVESVRHPGPEWFGDIVDDFGTDFDFVDDVVFEGASPEQLMAAVQPVPGESGEEAPDVVLIADGPTMRDPEHPVVVVPLWGRPGCAFRLPAVQLGNMVVNLALSNMDLEDFMDSRAASLAGPV